MSNHVANPVERALARRIEPIQTAVVDAAIIASHMYGIPTGRPNAVVAAFGATDQELYADVANMVRRTAALAPAYIGDRREPLTFGASLLDTATAASAQEDVRLALSGMGGEVKSIAQRTAGQLFEVSVQDYDGGRALVVDATNYYGQ
jgi:hypothetical protein